MKRQPFTSTSFPMRSLKKINNELRIFVNASASIFLYGLVLIKLWRVYEKPLPICFLPSCQRQANGLLGTRKNLINEKHRKQTRG